MPPPNLWHAYFGKPPTTTENLRRQSERPVRCEVLCIIFTLVMAQRRYQRIQAIDTLASDETTPITELIDAAQQAVIEFPTYAVAWSRLGKWLSHQDSRRDDAVTAWLMELRLARSQPSSRTMASCNWFHRLADLPMEEASEPSRLAMRLAFAKSDIVKQALERIDDMDYPLLLFSVISASVDWTVVHGSLLSPAALQGHVQTIRRHVDAFLNLPGPRDADDETVHEDMERLNESLLACQDSAVGVASLPTLRQLHNRRSRSGQRWQRLHR